jgi:non-ribosomal peptide synthetase component E (peptide arylation enzyme)
VVIPWESSGFNYFEMIKEIQPNLPTLRHIFVVGDEVPPGAISIKAMTQQPLEEKYPGDYLEKTKYSAPEVALITTTTGTTGLPKFIENSVCSRVNLGKQLAYVVRLNSEDVVVVTLTGFGAGTALALHGAPIVAAKIAMQERFDPEETLKLIEEERGTVLHFVPAQGLAMARHPNLGKYDLSSLRIIYVGGAAVNYSEAVEIEEKLGAVVMQGYGVHDCGAVNFSPSPDDPREIRLSTVGKPAPGCRIRLLNDAGEEVVKGEVGEIWATGPAGVSGYYKDPEATWRAWTEDGWFQTGDLGKLDEDGNLIIVGREKDMIIRGGQNIYPVEIESMLLAHPKILDVAIVSMPDPLMGEKACAFVIPRPGQQLTFQEMVSFLRAKKIASFKLPERLEIVDKFPMAAEQKVSKKALQQDIANKLKAEEKP